MHRYLVLFATTFMVLGMVHQAKAQIGWNPGATQSGTAWFKSLWPFHKKKAPEPVPITQSTPPESASARQAREKTDYLRRIAVCDKLRDIAFQTSDDELSRKADQLDQRAYAIFMKHTGQGMASTNLQADERILERRLGQNTPAGQELLPTQRASGSQASLREE